jgi:hypothetical protein
MNSKTAVLEYEQDISPTEEDISRLIENKTKGYLDLLIGQGWQPTILYSRNDCSRLLNLSPQHIIETLIPSGLLGATRSGGHKGKFLFSLQQIIHYGVRIELINNWGLTKQQAINATKQHEITGEF